MNSQKEIYVPVNGFPLFEVSNHGNVRELKTNTLVKPTLNKYGCPTVSIYNYCFGEFLSYKVQVNKLVANHFVDNKHRYIYVVNKDGNKDNNHESNIEWVNRIKAVPDAVTRNNMN
jgi:hypothetical protein